MNKETIINSLKANLKKLMFGDNATMNVSTTDGKNLIIMGSEIAEGLEIYMIDADNVQSNLPDGDYPLSDGTTITVTGNIITAIAAASPETASPDDTEMAAPADPKAATAPTDAPANGDIEKRLTDLETAVNKILELLTNQGSMNEQVMKSQKDLEVRLQVIADEPAETKIELKPKTNTIANSKQEFKADIEDIRKLISDKNKGVK